MAEQMISIACAREAILDAVRPLEHETVDIRAALERVLVEPVLATGDVPPFASSAMDGYAIRGSAAEAEAEAGATAANPDAVFTVVGESRAGAPAAVTVQDGQAVRISTGATVPLGATAVIRQEDVETDNGAIRIRAHVAHGQNIRGAGDDMRAGQPVLERGIRIGPAELAAAVAAGHGTLTCSARPRVAVLSTGDELRAPGEPLDPGQIHNSNAPMLEALVVRAGALPLPARVLRDDRALTEQALGEALAGADVLVVTGGVSVGPHDHVKPALSALGVQERFWRVALQPGKPTWFGVRDGQLAFGLPGNPVSTYVTFCLFVAPALAALQGQDPAPLASVTALLAEPVAQSATREQALRVVLERRGQSTVAIPNGRQGSHMLSSLLGADALALIPPGNGVLEAGTEVGLAPL